MMVVCYNVLFCRSLRVIDNGTLSFSEFGPTVTSFEANDIRNGIGS